VLSIRRATTDDEVFLQAMLAVAAHWRPDAAVRPLPELMSEPALAHYITGWPRAGDVGFVAEDGGPVGATWWRFFTPDDAGYGFVDDAIPELAIGIVATDRGRGVGTLLLDALIGEARRIGLPALSLSVDAENPAATHYERLGFVTVGHGGGSHTMVLTLGP
jgi:GNAT superfamily N-acetyltransferase